MHLLYIKLACNPYASHASTSISESHLVLAQITHRSRFQAMMLPPPLHVSLLSLYRLSHASLRDNSWCKAKAATTAPQSVAIAIAPRRCREQVDYCLSILLMLHSLCGNSTAMLLSRRINVLVTPLVLLLGCYRRHLIVVLKYFNFSRHRCCAATKCCNAKVTAL